LVRREVSILLFQAAQVAAVLSIQQAMLVVVAQRVKASLAGRVTQPTVPVAAVVVAELVL
jgi:hypothetical protein